MTRIPLSSLLLSLIFAGCSKPATDGIVWGESRLMEIEELPLLPDASVTLWRVEELEDTLFIWFRLSNLSDSPWECVGMEPGPHDRDHFTCEISNSAGWHRGADGVWLPFGWRGQVCGRPMSLPRPVLPEEGALLCWIEDREEARDLRVATTVRMGGKPYRASSGPVSRASIRRNVIRLK